MDIQQIKIYALNTFSFTVSFTQTETILKIILLLVSIGYTITKWYETHKRNK
jgi:hypothetical protein